MEELLWSFLKGMSFGVGKKVIELLNINPINSKKKTTSSTTAIVKEWLIKKIK
ncbi:hypothetical protein [Bacillus thuringiensis]|uniref:hypothetical protein n=1 Tax=Bacillus thuringiensis TaxID=1428 RepID=UPI001C44EB81|nr:hypothetical protein [Bacillus thuringiensis]MBV6681908.1 hypothetical protein [Bacillus thuringiensis]